MYLKLINNQLIILKAVLLFLFLANSLNANEIFLKGVWKFEQYEKSNINEPYDLLNLKFKITNDYKVKGNFEYFFKWYSRIEDLKEFNSKLSKNIFYFSFDSNFGGKNGRVKIKINEDCSLDWELVQEPNGEYYAPIKAHLSIVKIDKDAKICQYNKKVLNISLQNLESQLKQNINIQKYNKSFIQNVLHEKPIVKKTLTQYNNIAYYLQKAGANNEAIYILEKILNKYPNRTVAHYNIADAYWDIDNKQNAIKHYKLYVKQMKEKGKQNKIPKKVILRIQDNNK